MTYTHNTFDRRILLGASRRRLEDASNLSLAQRWSGSMYLGGYAIECSLKALICYLEGANNLQDTRSFKNQEQDMRSHQLTRLVQVLPQLQRAIETDRTGQYREAWEYLCTRWRTNELRYWDRQGEPDVSERFLQAVKTLHRYILEQQGELS